MTVRKTKTSSFRTGNRESHDASEFYARKLYGSFFKKPLSEKSLLKIDVPCPGEWVNKIYCQSSEKMVQIPDNSIALAFTSPPCHVGKEYENDMEF